MTRIARAVLVAGLGLGDEGKGSVVDWLVRTQGAHTVVRYNGGSQAAHHVVTTDDRTHCFAQFGSGTLVPGVRTFLSRFTIVDPLAMVAEERALRAIGVSDAFARLCVDPGCVVVTPFHRILNQMRELARGRARHGSCGLGIAEARFDGERPGLPVLRFADIMDADLEARLRLIWLSKLDLAEQLCDEYPDLPGLADARADLARADRAPALASAYRDLVEQNGITCAPAPTLGGTVIFEGAQGVLLDRHLGFWPHMTPSVTTLAHAHTLLGEWGGAERVIRWGVMRAYATRHGAGPLPTEDPELTDKRPDMHNGKHPWQGPFRIGWFDAVMARYALAAIGGVDRLLISNIDRLADLDQVRMCHAYQRDGASVRHIPRAASASENAARTRWLASCRPRYLERPGWSRMEPIPCPDQREYLDLLQSSHGMGATIHALSTGPTAADKHWLVPDD